MKYTLRTTFNKVAVLVYCLGAVGHIMVLVFKPPVDQMSNWVHGIVMLLSGYAGLGYAFNFKNVNFKSVADKIVYGLILFHLTVSALAHAYSIVYSNSDWLTVFKPSYSYFAITYFSAFAYYSYKLGRKLKI